MEKRATVGKVTSSGLLVCLACASDADLLVSHKAGSVLSSIVEPAPNGVYSPVPASKHYGEPCGLCGWQIRKSFDLR